MRQQDVMYRFLIENADVRGVFVRLDYTWQDTLSRADYPDPIKQVLGQMMAACVMLSASIKFEGKLTLQIQGDGPVTLLVVQITQNGKLRGMAKWNNIPADESLKETFGSAQMTISVSGANLHTQYHGVVQLVGDTLSDALMEYFIRSEQLDTNIILSVSANNAAGLMLQKLPSAQCSDADAWNRVRQLSQTVTPLELSSEPIDTLLHQLFHEDTLRLFEADEIEFECSCSREKISVMIEGLGQDEAESVIRDESVIEVTCEFCNAQYSFDEIDVSSIFNTTLRSKDNNTMH